MEGVTSTQLSLINEIPQRYENEKPSKTDPTDEKTTKETKFEELVIPNNTRRWPADLRYLEAFLNPGQDMVDLFTKEFALAGEKGPAVYPLRST